MKKVMLIGLAMVFLAGCLRERVVERRPDPEIERLNQEIDSLESARDYEMDNVSSESERRLKVLWRELERLKEKNKEELGKNKGLYENKLKELEDKIVELRRRNLDELKQLQVEKEALEKELEKYATSGDVSIIKTSDGITVRFLDRILFDSGKAVIKPEGMRVLDKVASIITKFPDREIRIEGHTDNVPINTALFPSNWELSAGRAVVVLRHLLAYGGLDAGGIAATRVSAVGFGEFHPLAGNDSDEGKSKNRRVDIIFVTKSGDDK